MSSCFAATSSLVAMVVQVHVAPEVGRVIQGHQAVTTCQSHKEVPGGGEEHTIPPRPGGIVNAAIGVYARDLDGTIDATAVVVRKACRHPSCPRSGGRQQTQR